MGLYRAARYTHASVVLAIGLSLLPVAKLQSAERAALRRALESITAGDLKAHVDVLADDSFEGREAGSRGGRAAGVYLLRHFERRGLKGGGDDGGYFQPFGNGYRNVLGILEGSDPELNRQVILVSAHYDHVGYGNGRNSFGPTGYIHNGADDNASGAAGLLESIDAFVSLPSPPKRSILFALWDGEEKGLLGSKHWLAYPTVPLRQVVLLINLDMIGRMRDGRLNVFGSRTGRGLRRLLSRNNQSLGLDLDFTWEMIPNSDHYPFFERGIPVLMLHTGLHDDYHRPSDDAHLINSEGMQRAARLLFNVAHELAERSEPVGFREASWRETPEERQRVEQPLPPLPPRLGVRWDKKSLEGGLLLVDIEPGSAADRAGIRAGDRLMRFAGRAITDPDQFWLRVLGATSPVPVVVQRSGDEKPSELTVSLDGKPCRLGISWREDDAEPGSTMITRVVPGSPASRAGLRTRDRIYEVSGREFANSEELFDLLTTLPSPLEMTIERQGRLQTVVLDVPPLD